MEEEELPTITVLRSWTVTRADRRAGIVIESVEYGPTVIEMNLNTINIVRQQLQKLEGYLAQAEGHA